MSFIEFEQFVCIRSFSDQEQDQQVRLLRRRRDRGGASKERRQLRRRHLLPIPDLLPRGRRKVGEDPAGLHQRRAVDRLPEEGADRSPDADDPRHSGQTREGHGRNGPGVHATSAAQFQHDESLTTSTIAENRFCNFL